MPLTPSISVSFTLKLPVRVLKLGGASKLMAGGVPVTPVNAALVRRQRDRGATMQSLEAYLRAVRLYVEFGAHLGRSIIDVTDAEFNCFKDALQGLPFRNSSGEWVRLGGKRERGKRTADLMLSLLYSLAGDIETLYRVRFDWRRYVWTPDTLDSRTAELFLLSSRFKPLGRVHTIKWIKPKVLGLPDDQFAKMLQAAHDRWGGVVTDGDVAFAPDPEAQRGALFYRNVAILLVLRYEGGRRSEVVHLTLSDLDLANSVIRLVTKGRGGEHGERLPVVLLPHVRDFVLHYANRYRPAPRGGAEKGRAVFRSHSVRNYGEPISPQTVRAVIGVLRPALDPPWDEIASPHVLRHSFAYDLQKHGGPLAVTANMRHSSIESSEPYAARAENFAEELLAGADSKLEEMFAMAGLSGVI
ncbi:MAG: site-specific integrase [Acidobacteriota bacterium]|nr:site-specific integrase [Acidobacteriota bacterium]